MGFWKTLFGLLRRGFVGPPTIGLALISGGVVFMITPTTYVSSGFMVATTSKSGGVIDPSKPDTTSNPLLQFDPSLKTTAAILIQQIDSPRYLKTLGFGPGSNATLKVNDGTAIASVMATASTGPFIYVEVTTTDPGIARNKVIQVEDAMRTALNDRQQQLQAPVITYLSLSDVNAPSDPVAQRSAKYEYAGGVLFLVIIIGFGGAYTYDRLREASAARRKATTSPAIKPPYAHLTGRDAFLIGASRPRSAGTGRARFAPVGGRPATDRPERPEREAREAAKVEETKEFPVVFDSEPAYKPSAKPSPTKPNGGPSNGDGGRGPAGGGRGTDVSAPSAG